MSLFYRRMGRCVIMIPERVPDGSGGYTTTWNEGESFMASVIRDTSSEARIAEAAGVVESYTVSVLRSTQLKYHDVFKRLTDGKVFRVTSDNGGMKAPEFASINMAQSTAEAWRLT